jgi:AcrR family transcriptional regulator
VVNTNTNARRERRIQRKREEIITAATRVIAHKGFAAATTKDIAEEADMGESTLYNYFESKRDILLAIMKEQQSMFDSILLRNEGASGRESLVNMMDQIMAIVIERSQFIRAMMLEAWIDDEILHNFFLHRLKEIIEIVQEFIQGQIQAGVFRPLEPMVIIRFMMGMFASYMVPILRGMQPEPTPEARRTMAESAITLLLDGVGTREGKSH